MGKDRMGRSLAFVAGSAEHKCTSNDLNKSAAGVTFSPPSVTPRTAASGFLLAIRSHRALML